MSGTYEQVSKFDLKPMHYMAVFSLTTGNLKEEDRKLLAQDAKFKMALAELNSLFQNNIKTLTGK